MTTDFGLEKEAKDLEREIKIKISQPKHHGVMDKSYDLFIIIMMPWGPGFESRFGRRRFLSEFELIHN